MRKVNIEVQYFDDCPNAREFVGIVKRALENSGIDCSYREVLVDSYDKAKEVGFRGSPTLLINGVDLENTDPPKDPGLNCRVYRNGLPTERDLVERIKAQVESPQQ